MDRISHYLVMALLAICGWLWFVTVPGLELSLVKAKSEAVALRVAVKTQNDQVAELERTAEALGALAGARLDAERSRSALRRAGMTQSGIGPEEMNKWQRALFY